MNYPDYLVHFNRNHGKKNGQFVSGDGDGDGVSNDRYNYKDNRKGQTKGSVVITTPSGKTLTNTGPTARVGRVGSIKTTNGKTFTNNGPTARVGRVGSITKAGSGGGGSKTEKHNSSYTETNYGRNYYNGIQLAKRDAKDTDFNEHIGNSNKKYIDGMKLTKSEGDIFRSNQNKKYVKNKTISAIKSKDTSIDSRKEVDMAKEDKMYQKETLWAGMKSVERLKDSKSSLTDSNSTSKGVNFVSSEILKLKV